MRDADIGRRIEETELLIEETKHLLAYLKQAEEHYLRSLSQMREHLIKMRDEQGETTAPSDPPRPVLHLVKGNTG